MWSAMLDSVGALSEVTSAVLEDPIYEAGFAVAGIAAADLGAKPMNGVAPWAWGWPGSRAPGDRVARFLQTA